MSICLEDCQRVKVFVEYRSTPRRKEKAVSVQSATRDRMGDGTGGKKRRTGNARRSERPDGQTRTPGEQRPTNWENDTGGKETSSELRATNREDGMGGTETSGERRPTKRENDTGGTETSSERHATKRKTGIARAGDGKPRAKRS